MPLSRLRRRHGFTLIELLVVIAILALLIGLFLPALGRAQKKAQEVACIANLRNIATAVQNYAQDNGNRYPMIEAMPSNPVYGPEDNAGTMLAVLGPYGVTTESLRCPADIAGPNNFAKEGSSYMWNPMYDDEPSGSPRVYFRRGEFVPPPSRIRLATDFERVKGGHFNAVFADGRVRTY